MQQNKEKTMSRTAEDKAQDYTAMGHSVDLINGIIGGTEMGTDTADQKLIENIIIESIQTYGIDEKKDCVSRNKEHLEIMVAKDDWGDEDMTASNSAIAAAASYLA